MYQLIELWYFLSGANSTFIGRIVLRILLNIAF